MGWRHVASVPRTKSCCDFPKLAVTNLNGQSSLPDGWIGFIQLLERLNFTHMATLWSLLI